MACVVCNGSFSNSACVDAKLAVYMQVLVHCVHTPLTMNHVIGSVYFLRIVWVLLIYVNCNYEFGIDLIESGDA